MHKRKPETNREGTLSVTSLLKTYVLGWRLVPIVFCLLGTSILTFVRPLIIKGITDEGMLKANMQMIILLSIILLISYILEQIWNILQVRRFIDIQNTIIRALYIKSFEKILHLKKKYFINHNASEIINQITTDISSVSLIADRSILSIISCGLSIFGGLIGLFLLNWKMALITVVVIPIKTTLAIKMSSLNEQVTSKNISLMHHFSSWFGDTVSGMKEIKLWNLQEQKKSELQCHQNEILKTTKQSTMYNCYNNTLMFLLSTSIQCVLYIFGGYLFIQGKISLGGVTAFIAYCGYVLGPISSLLSIRYMFAGIVPSLRRLNDFFEVEEEQLFSNMQAQKQQSDKIFSLELRNIKFSYACEDLLVNINLQLQIGEKIAIIGANGSGKSTLVDLILGFEHPKSGKILINGHDALMYSSEQYKNLFSVVEQEPYFFKDSLRHNLDPEGNYCDEDIIRVFSLCGIGDFFKQRLHGTLDQIIQFDAGDFSGGERKKLAIARAILKGAPILIMDEAAADYDVETEQELSRLIVSQFADKMLLYITHNYSYLDIFDRVYQLEKGELRQLTSDEIVNLKYQIEDGATLSGTVKSYAQI